ncbi:MAG: choice-of-anchor D domain-containing protein, partial [Bacteroidetes bacterium]|nr:choice-of-anchor D domain-containing protein [Bacteroidota bacterium]
MRFKQKLVLGNGKKRVRYILRFLVLSISVLSFLVGQTHFSPVEPTGLPYHVIISTLTLDEGPIPDDTEIGLFDDTLCVGATVISEAGEEDIDIVTWEGNTTYGLDGFTAGDTIRVLIWVNVYNVWTEIEVNPTVVVGDGTFGYGSFTILSLTINSGVVPILDTDVEVLDFGAVTIGSSTSLEITLINEGNADLNVESISINDPHFTIEPYTGTLPPGESVTRIVTFTPTTDSQENGLLTILSNDPVSPLLEIPLYGLGLPEVNASIVVVPDSLDFGAVRIGESGQETLQILNPGSEVLEVTEITISNPNFYVYQNVFSVPSGDLVTLQVAFAPQTTGMETGSIAIYSNAIEGNPVSVTVNGYGYNNYFDPVAPTGLPYTIVVNEVTVDNHPLTLGDEVAAFDGVVCVGAAVFTGNYPFQLVTWEAVPSQSLPGFTFGDSIQMSLSAFSYDYTMELAPEVTWIQGDGTFGYGDFSVVNLIALSGVEPVIRLNQAVLVFDSTPAGETSSKQFAVYNDGLSALTVSSVYSDSPVFQPVQESFTVASQDSFFVSLIFSPPEALPYIGILTLASDDPYAPEVILELMGQGTLNPSQILEVSVSPLQFNPTVLGDTSSVLLPLFNFGTAIIHVSVVTFDLPDFFTTPGSFDILPGESVNMPVYFSPTEVGHIQSFLTISNDSENLPSVSIEVNGVGYEGFFQPVESTGIPYIIIVDSLVGPYDSIAVGDEIGIFDGSLCVGTIVIGPLEDPDSLGISGIAWHENATNELPGFENGMPMNFLYFTRRSSIPLVFGIDYEIVEGSGFFGYEPFTVVTVVTSEVPIGSLVWPEQIQELPDLTIEEDSGPNVNLVQLNDYFSHPNSLLQFDVLSLDTTVLDLGVTAENSLILAPKLNQFGVVEAFIFASSNIYLTIYDRIQVTVTAVNDPPGTFHLLGPVDNSTIFITPDNAGDTLVINWEMAEDVENDPITYHFSATGNLDLLSPDPVSVPEIRWVYQDLRTLLSNAGQTVISGTWTITAADLEAATVAANGPFILTIDASAISIQDSGNLPDRYAIHQNYPNPFNSYTTRRYELPPRDRVSLVIHDRRGREIRRLEDTIKEPGV